ncbi:MAG TPA: hypothetical protein VE860_15580 [Chthoniobacterales bacterium]|nr:hypothetical protein [Chthoniobacterales bacterium]
MAESLTMFICFYQCPLRGQELVRTSALQPQILSFKNPEVTFRLGPFQEVLSANLGLEYTDNVNLTDTNKISDFSITEGLGLNTTWVISHLNQLQFNLTGDVTQNFYGNGRNDVTLTIDPGSLVQFQFAVSDFLFKVYNQFSLVQNPTSTGYAANTANLNSLTDTVGASVEHDLNIAVLSLSADYTYTNQTGTTASGQTNTGTTGTSNTFRVGSSLAFNYSPSVTYGIEDNLTKSSSPHEANVESFSIGPFIKGSFGPDLDLDLSAGANLVETTPSVPTDYYVSAALRYQVNRFWQVIFSAAHDLTFNTGTNLTDDNYFRLKTQLGITRFITIEAGGFYDYGDVLSTTPTIGIAALNTGPYKQLGSDVGVTWQLRKHISSTLGYTYIRREAKAPYSYIQNAVTLSIGYQF